MMCRIDREGALAMKERLRCGWQSVAQAMGVSVTDLRRVCDPDFAIAQMAARPAVVVAPPPVVTRRVPVVTVTRPTLENTPGGLAALRLLAGVGAMPDKPHQMAGVMAAKVKGVESKALANRLSRLSRAEPPLVDLRRVAGNLSSYRLSVAGWDVLQDVDE